jgi:NAD(P)H-hydrate epimerase
MPAVNGHFDGEPTIARLGAMLNGITAIVAGPGIGVSSSTIDLVAWLIEKGAQPDRPLLIDADGLNAVAQLGIAHLHRANGPLVLTPHPGEMSRLLGIDTTAVNADRISSARRLAEEGRVTALLKGNHSVIASPSGVIHINSTGNPGMATAGMGDVLSGIAGSLLGQKLAPFDALSLGVFIHGLAGDLLAQRIGPVGLLAGELADELPGARNAIELLQ